MNASRLAYDPNRLPWLPNEQRPPPQNPEPRRRRALPWALVIPWALLALLLLAGISYWLGMRSTRDELDPGMSAQAPAPQTSITLAEPSDPEPAPAPPVEVTPVTEPMAAVPEPVAPVRAPERPRPRAAEPATPAKVKTKSRQARARPTPSVQRERKPRALEAWPAAVSKGASGRMVRIGTFHSARQAKRAWWQLMRAYPGMQRLRAVVVPVPSLRNSQTYYRLQFGTTSHAHSAILCQRMLMIGQPCVVIGLDSGGRATG